MDFLKLNDISNEEKAILIELAIINYDDELQANYFQNLKLKNISNLDEKLIIINKAIHDCLTTEAPYSKIIISKDLDKNNPANFDFLTCLKLILCSRRISYMWKIPYPILYKCYYALLKENSEYTIDLFIGKIREYWNKDSDKDFELFEKLTILKYEKIKLEDI
jgi:hypothetical protein